MSETNPSLPGGAVPPKPPESSKVQPKKETVRINLPPKPSAAPTIKLPTLPPGGPSAGVPGGMPTPAPIVTAAPATSAPARVGAAPIAPATSQKPVQRPVVPVRAPALSGVDMVLAIAAAVAALVAVGSTLFCMSLFN